MAATRLAAAAFLLLAALTGCNRASNERYIPSAPLAREALTAAMESWLRGEDEAQLPAGKPKIELIDSQRKGRQLTNYKILGELGVDGGRRFDVRLHLTKPEPIEVEQVEPEQVEPEQVVTVQYIVLGIDPLWVMHKRDYDAVTHWEMDMEEPRQELPSEEKPNE